MFHLPLFRHRASSGPKPLPVERRRFPRVKAPVLVRPAGRSSGHRPVQDIGLGGLRVYSDEAFELDQRLTLELLLPEDSTVECLVRVAWVRKLELDEPACYDVGFQILQAHGSGLERLATVLEQETRDL